MKKDARKANCFVCFEKLVDARLLLVTAGAVCFWAQSATADTLIPDYSAGGYIFASYYQSASAPPGSLPINLSEPGSPTVNVSAGLTIAGGSAPTIIATAGAVASEFTGDATATASGTMYYYFQITGSATDPIPVYFQGHNTSLDVDTGFQIVQSRVSTSIYDMTALLPVTSEPNHGEYDYNELLSLTPGHIYQVYLSADVTVVDKGDYSGGTFSADPVLGAAIVDPTFTIDSTATGYSIQYSPGLVPATGTTPLPPSWSMMVIGLAGLGFGGFRRKNARAGDLPAC